MRLASLLALGVALSLPASAQISFTGEYYQDFEDLGTDAQAALPDGWSASVHPTVVAPSADTYAAAVTATDMRGGSFFQFDSPVGVVNFGSGPENTAGERALGFSLRGGEAETGILYVHFRNDTGAPITEALLSDAREMYRGGGSGRLTVTEYVSRDGVTWTSTGGGGASSISGFLDGAEFPPIGGGGGTGSFEPGTPILPGEEWYLAYRYSSADASSPSGALDRFALASPRETAGVVFLDHGDVELGPFFIGDVGYTGARFKIVAIDAPAGIAEVTGPHAQDFVVTEVTTSGFGSSQFVQVEFRPTAHGWRDASLRLFAADTVGRPISLRGFGVDPSGNGGGTTTASEDDAALAQVLLDLWPNPTLGAVNMRVTVAEMGPVRLSIHDALGREVGVVLDRTLSVGSHEASFDGTRLTPGVYFTRLVAQGETVTSALTISR